MMKNRFKIAIIGAGYMAEEYLKVLVNKKVYCEGIFFKNHIQVKNFEK